MEEYHGILFSYCIIANCWLNVTSVLRRQLYRIMYGYRQNLKENILSTTILIPGLATSAQSWGTRGYKFYYWFQVFHSEFILISCSVDSVSPTITLVNPCLVSPKILKSIKRGIVRIVENIIFLIKRTPPLTHPNHHQVNWLWFLRDLFIKKGGTYKMRRHTLHTWQTGNWVEIYRPTLKLLFGEVLGVKQKKVVVCWKNFRPRNLGPYTKIDCGTYYTAWDP